MKTLIFLKNYFFLTPKKFYNSVINNDILFYNLKQSVKNVGWDIGLDEFIMMGVLTSYLRATGQELDYKKVTIISNKLFGQSWKPCLRMFEKKLKELKLI